MKDLMFSWQKRYLSRILILFLIFFFSKSLLLRGGERQGWIFSPDVGIAVTKYTEDLQPWSSPESHENRIKGGGSIGGKFGYAPNNQLMFVFLSASNIFMKKVYSETVALSNIIGAVGISYYLKETHPSIFFDIGIGIASWTATINPKEIGSGPSEGYLGYGGIIGIGYEFAHGWSVENRIFYNRISFSRDNVDGTANTLSCSISFSYSLYGLWK